MSENEVNEMWERERERERVRPRANRIRRCGDDEPTSFRWRFGREKRNDQESHLFSMRVKRQSKKRRSGRKMMQEQDKEGRGARKCVNLSLSIMSASMLARSKLDLVRSVVAANRYALDYSIRSKSVASLCLEPVVKAAARLHFTSGLSNTPSDFGPKKSNEKAKKEQKRSTWRNELKTITQQRARCCMILKQIGQTHHLINQSRSLLLQLREK